MSVTASRSLVFASRQVLDAAAPIVGAECLERVVSHAIERGQVSRTPREGEPRLKASEYLVRPFERSWVAVVIRGPGRLVKRRKVWNVVHVCERA